ncbi:MAG: YfhO family protein [bacterium]|nr:YfhO family protein [bacterium]
MNSARPEPSRGPSLRETLGHTVLLVLVLACLFPSVFLKGHVTLPGQLLYDTPPWADHAPQGFEPLADKATVEALSQFACWYAIATDAIRAGEWPLWNRFQCMGMPLMANFQSAVFYPVHVLHLFLDLFLAMTVYTLLKFWLCGMVTYVCARALGLGRMAARFISIGWMLCGINVIWSYWPLPEVGAWLPLVFFGAERVLQARYRPGFMAITVGGTLMLLAGHPESAFAAGCGIGLYFVLRLVLDRAWGRRLWIPLSVAGGAWVVALLICSVQLLPFLEYLPNSFHGAARPDTAAARTLVPSALIQFWVPRFFGANAEGNYWGSGVNSNFANLVYLGLAPWFAIALAVPLRRCLKPESRRLAALIATALVCLLCGFSAPVVSPVLSLPPFNVMMHIWWVLPATFALLVAGGIIVERWFRESRSIRQVAPALAGILVVSIAGYLLYRFYQPVLAMEQMDSCVRRQLWTALALAIVSLAILAAPLFLGRRRLWAHVFLLVFAADLLLATRGTLPTAPRDMMFPRTGLTDHLAKQPEPYRVCGLTAGIPVGFLPIMGVEEFFGYDAILPLRYSNLVQNLGEDVWRGLRPALDLRFFLHNAKSTPYFLDYGPKALRKVETHDGMEVYKDSVALGRVFLVGRAEVRPNEEDMIAAMRSPEFDPADVALVEDPLPAPIDEVGETRLGEARVVERTANRVVIDASANRPCVMVLSDAYYPGWRATANGETLDIFPVYSLLRGVVLPAGDHRVEFTYRPSSFRVGLAISTVTLLLCLLTVVGPACKRVLARKEP